MYRYIDRVVSPSGDIYIASESGAVGGKFMISRNYKRYIKCDGEEDQYRIMQAIKKGTLK